MKRTLATLAAATVMAGYNTAANAQHTPEAQWAEGIIMITSPKPCSDITGNPRITFKAPGIKTVTVTAFNAAANNRKGAYETIAKDIPVGEDNTGSFTFPAGRYPRGPLTITLSGVRANGKTDNNYLQLYNKGGIAGIHGMPSTPPPAAKGMKLVFSDNFDKPLSIGKGSRFKYYDHKPPDGSQDFSQWENHPPGAPGYRFTCFEKPNNPFARVDNFLRIRASTEAQSTGIISSMQGDGSGFKVLPPAYFECRFIAPNAIGTWPAFWLLTDTSAKNFQGPCDELDIIEAYGGEGDAAPNAFDKYMICPHAWGQGEEGKAIEGPAYAAMNNPQNMKAKGVSSAWYESFHTYGCLITEEWTVYYCDDIEMGRHKTMPVSWADPHYFLANLAIGGISGWRIDLSRVHGLADMYVDYIRVYQGERK